jgi:hypothetical protein
VAPGPDNTFVDCPMPMVNRSNATFSSDITVVDPNTGSHIICSLHSVCWGSNGVGEHSSSSVTSSQGVEVLHFDTIDQPGCGIFRAHWYISCQIPPGGRIVNYRACTSSGADGC